MRDWREVTRKREPLEKRKTSKKKMRQFGRVDIPPEAFVNVLNVEAYLWKKLQAQTGLPTF